MANKVVRRVAVSSIAGLEVLDTNVLGNLLKNEFTKLRRQLGAAAAELCHDRLRRKGAIG